MLGGIVEDTPEILEGNRTVDMYSRTSDKYTIRTVHNPVAPNASETYSFSIVNIWPDQSWMGLFR